MRSVLLGFMILSLLIATPSSFQPVVVRAASDSLVQQRVSLACSFLKNLYNPSLGLVRVTSNSNVYYISSDNILAEKALSPSYCNQPTVAASINQSISTCCGTGYDGMHEVLLGVPIHLPIHQAKTFTVANSTQGRLFRNVSSSAAGGNYTVLWEVHNSTGIFPDCTYADVTVYNVLESKRENNSTDVNHEIECLQLMFDGRGLVDEAFKNGSGSEHGIYQTFTLALYLAALQATGSYYYRQEDNLLRSQGPDGGFHTGYDEDGTYAGTLENAETTSIAIIVLSTLAKGVPIAFPFLSIPFWLIAAYATFAGVAVGIVVLLLYLDRRKLSRMPPLRAMTRNPFASSGQVLVFRGVRAYL